MYHLYDLYVDVQDSVEKRYDGSFWSAYTPVPFLYALSCNVAATIQRKTPQAIRKSAVWSRDQIEELSLYLSETASYIKTHTVVRPVIQTAEEYVKFIVSDDMIELYVVLKSRIETNAIGRYVISTVESIVLLPFPSREQVLSGADQFMDVSRRRIQLVLHFCYSATEVFEQHWTSAQWNILGRGPYESLAIDRRCDIVQGVYQRTLCIESSFRLYEFLASIKAQNEMLYVDLMRTYPSILRHRPEAKSMTVPSPCWFYKDQEQWIQFPSHENRRLERSFQQGQKRYVAVEEGRMEVDLETMQRYPVYWSHFEPQKVQRAIWLYAERNYELTPYSDSSAATLEAAFCYFVENIETQVDLLYLSIPIDGHLVEFRSEHEIIQSKRLLAGKTFFTTRRRVYRGDPRKERQVALPTDDDDITSKIDHLVLIVHGIGEALRTLNFNVVQLKSILDCADSLRKNQKDSVSCPDFETIPTNRVEYLPIEWHSKLHTAGLDQDIQEITLPAVSKLREFANDTILDVLYFMSPAFHHLILAQVKEEMNRVYELFQKRNPHVFSGKVSILAHSLGAVVCFDILNDAKQLDFNIQNFFMLGSPLALFLKVRGQELPTQLPNCERLYNIYHPYDPIAYRMEPLITRHLTRAQIIPTFEGRLRYQYQIKQAVKTLWNGLWSWKSEFEAAVEHVIEGVGLLESQQEQRRGEIIQPTAVIDYGRLCQGNPIDYSLQENEIEIANEYLFALTSHSIYWTNRDASLFMVKQLYQ